MFGLLGWCSFDWLGLVNLMYFAESVVCVLAFFVCGVDCFCYRASLDVDVDVCCDSVLAHVVVFVLTWLCCAFRAKCA